MIIIFWILNGEVFLLFCIFLRCQGLFFFFSLRSSNFSLSFLRTHACRHFSLKLLRFSQSSSNSIRRELSPFTSVFFDSFLHFLLILQFFVLTLPLRFPSFIFAPFTFFSLYILLYSLLHLLTCSLSPVLHVSLRSIICPSHFLSSFSRFFI